MSKRQWELSLAAALESKPAQRWLKAQNERELARIAARAASSVPSTCTTVSWTDRVQLTVQQKDQLEHMINLGWQVWGIAYSLEERVHAVACKHAAENICGVLYPTGELERGACFKFRHVDQWTTRMQPLQVDKRLKAAPRPMAVMQYREDRDVPEYEAFPSNAIQVSRVYSELEA